MSQSQSTRRLMVALTLTCVTLPTWGCRVCSPQPNLRQGAHWIMPGFGRSGGSPQPCCNDGMDYSSDLAGIAAQQQAYRAAAYCATSSDMSTGSAPNSHAAAVELQSSPDSPTDHQPAAMRAAPSNRDLYWAR
ncbi:MAG: hypothetical protein KDB23_09395 [Planctomycetales bacterium]|nr:hypothetical protein [Planctomycetales bacterium]